MDTDAEYGERVRNRLIDSIVHGGPDHAWSEVVLPLVQAVDDLHACIEKPEWNDVRPEVRAFCVALHRELHHPEDFND